MTWVKAELTDEQDGLVEQYQDEFGLSKPEAVAKLVDGGLLSAGYKDD